MKWNHEKSVFSDHVGSCPIRTKSVTMLLNMFFAFLLNLQNMTFFVFSKNIILYLDKIFKILIKNKWIPKVSALVWLIFSISIIYKSTQLKISHFFIKHHYKFGHYFTQPKKKCRCVWIKQSLIIRHTIYQNIQFTNHLFTFSNIFTHTHTHNACHKNILVLPTRATSSVLYTFKHKIE